MTDRPPGSKVSPGSSPIKVSDETIRKLNDVFGLLADRSRLKIVLALGQEGEMHVSALCELLGQSQPAVSHHLSLMRMVGLVGFRRDGKHNYYRLASHHMRDLIEQFFTDQGNTAQQLEYDEFTLTFQPR